MVHVEVQRVGALGRVRADCGAIRGIIITGHAGDAAAGENIVCAAVSVTAYTAAGALNGLCGTPYDCAEERGGFFKLTVPDFDDGDKAYRAEIIMETAFIGFKQIELTYGKFIRVSEKTIN